MTPHIGEIIKAARLKAKLTQLELGDKLGISKNHISAIESGRENVTVKTLEKIAKALDTDLEILFKKQKNRK